MTALPLPPSSQWQCLKADKAIAVYRALLADATPVVIKAYQLTGLRQRLAFSRRCRRLRRFYAAGCRDFAPPLLSTQVSEQGDQGYLVYQWVDGQDLRQWSAAALSEPARQALARHLGSLLAALHGAGWVHGDCKFGNLLCQQQGDNDWQVYLVDLEAVTRPWFGRDRRYGRDLARLLLDALEREWPQAFIATVWQSYRADLKPPQLSRRRRATGDWLSRLAARHERRYGRQVVIDLPFL